MDFYISIKRNSSLEKFRVKKEYDANLDGIYSILFDICNFIDGHVDFLVSGFGDSHWPVDVRTDLPSFIEQIPKCKILAEAGRDFSLNFYEQGVQRTVEFSRSSGAYTATCTSGCSWVPRPQTVTLECLSVSKMLEDVLMEFSDIVMIVAPEIYDGLWFSRWLRGTEHTD